MSELPIKLNLGYTPGHYKTSPRFSSANLVVETPNANLVSGMAWLQSTYAIRLNNRKRRFGRDEMAYHRLSTAQ